MKHRKSQRSLIRMDGKVLTANQNFLCALLFAGRIEGQEHSLFIAAQARDANGYARSGCLNPAISVGRV